MEFHSAAPVSSISSLRKPRTRPHLESCETALPTPILAGEGRGRLFSEGSDDFTLPHAAFMETTNPEGVYLGRSSPKTMATAGPLGPQLNTPAALARSEAASPPPPKQRTDTPPPAPRVHRPLPPLMKALERNSLQLVEQVLEVDPSAAQDIFWEHCCEPPLCCAARLGCSRPILALLLQHGADIGAVDRRGRTPLGIISAGEPYVYPPLPNTFPFVGRDFNPMDASDAVQIARQQNKLEGTRLLIEARADIEHVDLSGSKAMDYALRAGNQPLLQEFAAAAV